MTERKHPKAVSEKLTHVCEEHGEVVEMMVCMGTREWAACPICGYPVTPIEEKRDE